jgi:hypothetical protein
VTEAEFEGILDELVTRLGNEVRASTEYHDPKAFQQRALDLLQEVAAGRGIAVAPTWHRNAFPDIKANGFGIEVKTTTKDSWLSVGNSVFEGMRDTSVSRIYVVFGKFGGMPGVQWGRYEERITHVRISHAPRFVLEMDRDAPLFQHMKIEYNDFAALTPAEKMDHIREYSRGRLKPGEALWWLEDEASEGIPLEVRLYMHLTDAEKRQYRAEGALLFPRILSGSRVKGKYEGVAFYLLQHRNVFCPQTRDLFSAGSVAGKERGGNYLMKAMLGIQEEMKVAARDLPGELFEEHWGRAVEPAERLREWLGMADAYATNWKPSEHMFR